MVALHRETASKAGRPDATETRPESFAAEREGTIVPKRLNNQPNHPEYRKPHSTTLIPKQGSGDPVQHGYRVAEDGSGANKAQRFKARRIKAPPPRSFAAIAKYPGQALSIGRAAEFRLHYLSRRPRMRAPRGFALDAPGMTVPRPMLVPVTP